MRLTEIVKGIRGSFFISEKFSPKECKVGGGSLYVKYVQNGGLPNLNSCFTLTGCHFRQG